MPACGAVLLLALAAGAADFAISTTDGKQVLLSQYKGKAVVLAFILTYCSHCQAVTGYLIQDQNEFGPRGLQVLASSIEDHPASAVPNFVRQFHPPFPVGFNTNREAVYNYLQHPSMLILKMPALVFIDRQGVVRARYKGDSDFLNQDRMGANIRRQIEELLGDRKPAPENKR